MNIVEKSEWEEIKFEKKCNTIVNLYKKIDKLEKEIIRLKEIYINPYDKIIMDLYNKQNKINNLYEHNNMDMLSYIMYDCEKIDDLLNNLLNKNQCMLLSNIILERMCNVTYYENFEENYIDFGDDILKMLFKKYDIGGQYYCECSNVTDILGEPMPYYKGNNFFHCKYDHFDTNCGSMKLNMNFNEILSIYFDIDNNNHYINKFHCMLLFLKKLCNNYCFNSTHIIDYVKEKIFLYLMKYKFRWNSCAKNNFNDYNFKFDCSKIIKYKNYKYKDPSVKKYFMFWDNEDINFISIFTIDFLKTKKYILLNIIIDFYKNYKNYYNLLGYEYFSVFYRLIATETR